MSDSRAMFNIVYGAMIMDGEVKDEEINLLNGYIDRCYDYLDFDPQAQVERLSSDPQYFRLEMDFAIDFFKSQPLSARQTALRAAILMVQIDGQVHRHEAEYITTLTNSWGVDIDKLFNTQNNSSAVPICIAEIFAICEKYEEKDKNNLPVMSADLQKLGLLGTNSVYAGSQAAKERRAQLCQEIIQLLPQGENLIIEAAASAPFFRMRANMVAILGSSNSKESEVALIKALDDPSENVIGNAIKSIKNRRISSAKSKLLTLAQKYPGSILHVEIQSALGYL